MRYSELQGYDPERTTATNIRVIPDSPSCRKGISRCMKTNLSGRDRCGLAQNTADIGILRKGL